MEKVFRIGGDEFCVILTRAKIGKMQSKMEQFELKLLEANTKLAHPIDVAWGYAETNNDEGISTRDAFTLADKSMLPAIKRCSKRATYPNNPCKRIWR